MIELRSVDDTNRDLLCELRLKPGQERFVTSVAGSIAEALDEPGGKAIQWGLYDGELPVGFVMISDDVDGDEYFSQFLWKLLIDERYQGRGYGRAAVDRVVEYFRHPNRCRPIADELRFGEGGPLGFFERYGFVPHAATSCSVANSCCGSTYARRPWLKPAAGSVAAARKGRSSPTPVRAGPCRPTFLLRRWCAVAARNRRRLHGP